ncbi:myb family transcription factor EFM [Sesamum indicum]|uniref:Myb family transcription factor EFM n=1 Tax=Sesamum indicum TaxID=4182 RepID=A0A6I9TMI6_SESIN|nr:myb family transcription factor EFM [Sesamum indicum]
MGQSMNEVNLNVGWKTLSDILKQEAETDDSCKKTSEEVDVHVQELEEELRKIDAFKRELPYCILLLKDAIERLKWRRRELELLKRGSEGDGMAAQVSNDFTKNKNLMSSAQLWKHDSVFHLTSRYEEGEGNGSENRCQGCNFKNRVGAFVPFKKPSGTTIKDEKGTAPVHGVSLSLAEVEATDWGLKGDGGSGRTQPQQQEQQRKQRRCWSPELHQRFVDALHHLGGPQTATPKQIRELMKVDGLTNDEVKSHLQKYRIHIRKLSTPPPELPGDTSKPLPAHFGFPPGPFFDASLAATADI